MKKFLLTSILLLLVLAISAQVKVAPQLRKGDKKVYVTEATATTPMLSQKTTIQTVYQVKDVTPEGYVIESLVEDVKIDTDTTNLANRIAALTASMTKGICISFLTDKDGQILKVLHFDEVVNQTKDMLSKMLDNMPLPDVMSKEAMMNAAMSKFNEETMLNSIKMNHSPYALNGKTISDGTEDEFTYMGSFKMKRTYALDNDGSIKASSVINFTPKDMMDMVASMVGDKFADKKEELQKEVEKMAENNMLMISGSDNTTYTFCPDGWVESISSETKINSMGQQLTVTSKVMLKK